MSVGKIPSGAFVDATGDLVRRRTGLVFTEARRSALSGGVVAAMHRANVTDQVAYLARLDAEPELLDDLVGDITVGETYFFREPRQFAALRREILPALISARPDHPLRVWSAGCASGEEPYSLAILLRELDPNREAYILGTDLSRAALVKARSGRYTRWSLRGVPEDMVRRYFDRSGREFALATAVTDAVEFRYLNLAEDTYPSFSTRIWGMDLILCRNVLIYFDADTIAKVAHRLIDSLSDEGRLLLGSSDPMLADLVRCEVMVTGAGLAYRRVGVRKLGSSDLRMPVAAPTAALEAVAESVPGLTDRAQTPAAAAAQTSPVSDAPAEAGRYYAARDYGRAAELAAELVSRDGRDPALWIVLVRALANRGELGAAGRACAAALDCHRTSAELAYLHAVLLAEARQHVDAAAAARRALYLDRGLVMAHLTLGGTLARLGDVVGAHTAFRNAERLLAAMAADEVVPASDGECAGRLAQMARAQVQLLPRATV